MKHKPFETISASSISTFLDCPRRWYFKYVLGERVPPSKAMRHGTAVHKDIEEYLTGVKQSLDTTEAVEANAKGYIPNPDRVENEYVEWNASEMDLTIEGLRVLGYLDLVQEQPSGKVRVTDWKTRGGFSYAPASEELLDDLQAKLYAWIAFQKFPSLDEIEFRHVNILRVDGEKGRKSPRSTEVSCIFFRDEVESWASNYLVGVIREMKSCAVKTSPKTVRRNTDSCYKYGPCEYMSPIKSVRGRTCHDIPYNPKAEKAKKKESKMSMMDLIGKRKSKKKKEPEKTSQSAVEITDQGPVDEEVSDLVGDKTPEDKPNGSLEQAKADFLDGKNDFDLADYELSHMDKRAFILWRKKQLVEATEKQKDNDTPPVNPPDAAPDEEPIDLEDQKVADYDFEKVDGVGAKTADNIREFIVENEITDLIELLDVNLRKIHGIGKKGETNLIETIKRERNWTPDDDPEQEESTGDQADQGGDDTEPDDLPNEVKAQKSKTPGGAYDQEKAFIAAKKAVQAGDDTALGDAKVRMTGVTKKAFEQWMKGQTFNSDDRGDQGEVVSSPSVLYIDCYPTKGPRPVDLGDLLAPIKQEIAEEEGVEYWNVNAYGKARKWITEGVLADPQFLVDEPAVFARSTDQGMDHLLPEIRQFFDLVIEG